MQHITRLVWALFSIAIFLGVGALCHAQFVGDLFDPDSMMSWGWLLAWPIGLLLVFLKWVLIGVGVLIVIVVLIAVFAWALEVKGSKPATPKEFDH